MRDTGKRKMIWSRVAQNEEDGCSTGGNEVWSKFGRGWVFPETSEGVGRAAGHGLEGLSES